MLPELIEILRCPRTARRLHLEEAEYRDGEVFSGYLVSGDDQHRYPIRDFIPRFVAPSNYAASFGMQWNKFRQTQLDSYTGHPISAGRFWDATGWNSAELRGSWVLDIGCGAGRFAEVALEAGANVVALDYSSAVDACLANLRTHRNLHVVQGDIYALPLRRAFFPLAYSLGVLQHTPDVDAAFAALPPILAPGGRLCVDVYEKNWKIGLLPRKWLHPFTRRMPRERLFALLERFVPRMFPISRAFGRVPCIGWGLKRLVPVADYTDLLPLSPTQLLEWSLLDTFDWLSPEYDQPQTAQTVRRWFEGASMEEIEVLRARHLVGRGRMKNASRH